MILLFTATIFTSSLLVFLIQPMFARMVLPALGGSPAVWNTAMLFYQGGLLLGYTYAHLGPRLLSVRRHAVVHMGVMLLPLLVLPVAIPVGWSPPVSSNPAPWLLALMAVAIGLPYLVVSSSNPLLQRWFAASGHRLSADPYFLYAASNAGSMLALLAYPLLAAPLLFNSMAEYPLVVSLAPLLVLAVRGKTGPWSRRLDVLLPAGLLALTLGLVVLVQRTPLATDPAGLVVMFGLPVFLIYLLSTRPLRFALGVGAVLLASGLYGETEEVLLEERTFFGVLRVTFNPATGHNRLSHGRTLHGLQSVSGLTTRRPLAYYTAAGPAGQIFNAYGRASGQRIGAVGLGIGALAAYGLPGQQWTLFEIDPAVVRIAENPKFFTHLSGCSGDYKVVLGDARRSLHALHEARFSLLVLDAYSSDAIPMHMATSEALALYMSRLEGRGILAFHLSNQHLDLVPVMAALARDAGLTTLYREDLQVSEEEAKLGKEGSRWLVMARRPEHLARLARDARWKVAADTLLGPPWSDDHASILQALDW